MYDLYDDDEIQQEAAELSRASSVPGPLERVQGPESPVQSPRNPESEDPQPETRNPRPSAQCPTMSHPNMPSGTSEPIFNDLQDSEAPKCPRMSHNVPQCPSYEGGGG